MADEEVWKPIPGHKGYEASNLGRIRSLDRWVTQSNGVRRFFPGVIFRPATRADGYLITHLGPSRSHLVHCLIALAFWGEPRCNLGVCHNNGKRADNRLTNLRYDTPASNQADMVKHGNSLQGEKHHNCKLTEATVRFIRQSDMSRKRLSALFGVLPDTIGDIQRRKSWAWMV